MSRERFSLDSGWSFSFGHPSDTGKDFRHGTRYFTHLAKAGFADGPADAGFEDRAWRRVDLPHDWAVELPFDGKGSHSHGYHAVGMAYPDTSVAWYRKKFFIAKEDLGRKIWIEFDGIYRDAQIWVNGFLCGREEGGYLGFRSEVSDYLNYDGTNVLSVRVDARMEEGWFYEGAGIYRHVWLDKMDSVHVVHDGIFARAAIDEKEIADAGASPVPGGLPRMRASAAKIEIDAEILNEGISERSFIVTHVILSPDGKEIVHLTRPAITLRPNGREKVNLHADLRDITLWSPDDPVLYRIRTELRAAAGASDEVIDSVETTFGFRVTRIDPNEGFFINGRHLKLVGSNNHQDHAGLGVALPDSVQEARVARLKDMGSNAYRCSHHPPAKELLDACDRLGMLVIDENRLMGTGDYLMLQVERMMKRDRNHPSVFLWSLGNEEWAIEGNEKGARIAKTMQEKARAFDTTRPFTVAISGGWNWGISTVVEVMGYNYISHGSTDEQHAKFPWQGGIGTEETTTQGVRGVYEDDLPRCYRGPVENGTSGFNAVIGWKHYASRPYLAGIFYWTGFDYRGEPVPFAWPAVASQFGIMDTCGFAKDIFYYHKSWWLPAVPTTHIAAHWNHEAGKTVKVIVYSNAEEVELSLNGKSLGTKKVEANDFAEWLVSFAEGSLVAIGKKGGKEVSRDERHTAGPSAKLRLSCGFVPGAKARALKADGADTLLVMAEALDASGVFQPLACEELGFEILPATPGAPRIVGVGNGDSSSHEPDRFIGTVTDISASSWTEREFASVEEAAPHVPVMINNNNRSGDWKPAFWVIPYDMDVKSLPPVPALSAYRGRIDIAKLEAGMKATLIVGTWADEMDVWVNGIQVATGLKKSWEGHVIDIDVSILQEGYNLVAIIARGLGTERMRFAENFQPVHLRLEKPAAGWKRKLFNGLAQVLVKAGTEAGSWELVAKADGLEAGRLAISCEGVKSAPAL